MMELSILSGETMDFGDDDSFLFTRAEEMDDEVTQIFKKWKLNNPPLPKQNGSENINNSRNETFDTRTFTRPTRRKTFNINDHLTSAALKSSFSMSGTQPTNSMAEMQSMESGIASINLHVGEVMTPLSMQKSWLLDVSPPSSICTSMDFQNTDMLNSLITSSDFSNVSFLLNGTTDDRRTMDGSIKINNNTITIDNNATLIPNNTSNLMNFTYAKRVSMLPPTSNCTFITSGDSGPPLKEIGIENADIQLSESVEDVGKNLTFNKYEGDNANLTWEKIQSQKPAVVQSTPVHNTEIDHDKLKGNFDDDTLSPISSLQAQINANDVKNRDEEVLLRSFKSRKLIDQIRLDDYRNSMEDQCEFLLNEETIKLSSRVCKKDTNALISSTTTTYSADLDDEKEFDKMLDSFNVKKSLESEKLLQSVDSIKQRHSLINMEKQREGKHRRDTSENDNKVQYDAMMNKSSERLLNRRSRLYDDVNLQLQKQQQSTTSINGMGDINNVENDSTKANSAENDNEVVVTEKNIQNDRDRFKTIKLNKPRLQTGMVIIDTQEPEATKESLQNEVFQNKDRQNQINQQKQESVEKDFKKPAPLPSKMSKFGFGLQRPSYSSRNNLNLPLKANSTDSLDNDETTKVIKKSEISNMKSPMGIKSKSIHNLMFNGAQQSGIRMTSNLRQISSGSQTNLKAPRASSLVRPNSIVENGNKVPQNPSVRKTSLVRPSSGYYGNAYTNKRLDSDSESYSLSSSSASSRNSVHLSLAPTDQHYTYQQNEELNVRKISNGAIPKPQISRPIGSGLPRPSGLPTQQSKSGLPRPNFTRR